MARIIGQIESSKALRAELNKRNIHRFNSVGDIKKFQKDFLSEKQHVLLQQENRLNEEINEMSSKVTKLKEEVDQLKQEETERLNTKINNYTITESIFVNTIGSIAIDIIRAIRARRNRKKIKYLEDNFELIINNSTRGLREQIFHLSNKINYSSENKEEVIKERGKPQIVELENTQQAIEELRPLIAGAVGESKVENEISKLSDEYILINDFSLKFKPPIYNKKTQDRIYSIQLDHLLISRTGLFALETKNWSRKSVNSLDLRSPVDQLLRTTYALGIVVDKKIKLAKHHWGERTVPIRRIIVMINNKPPAEFKYVKVKQLNELNSYIEYFDTILSAQEVEYIADTLLKEKSNTLSLKRTENDYFYS